MNGCHSLCRIECRRFSSLANVMAVGYSHSIAFVQSGSKSLATPSLLSISTTVNGNQTQKKQRSPISRATFCPRGVCSNTGICIHRTLSNSLFLLRGLPGDEAKLSELWGDVSYLHCVLWPGDDAISVTELKAKLDPDRKLLLIVPDGTFSGARRMTKKYPDHCIKVALSSESVLGGKMNSLLYPVRKYGGSEYETGRVSTLEAVAAFMRELGEDSRVAEALISNMQLQMDRALKQKSKAMVYGTSQL